MKYQEAMQYIEECGKYGIVPGLSGIRELLERLNNPQSTLKVIHIAGTNGKGSVLAFISQMLHENGYRVGRYISPAITEYRERFQISQRPISKRKVAELMEEVAGKADRMEEEGFSHPTAFEIETAMAFLLFQKEKCDFVVLETGMGGELDATNVIEEPLVCVLTSISMDHMQFLGATLEEIALQKAGIIKRKAGVVSAEQLPAVEDILKQECRKKEALEPVFVRQDKIQQIKYGLKSQRFHYGEHRNLKITMAGIWQIENACVAWEVMECMKKRGIRLEEEKLRRGLELALWPGRFQILSKSPYFIIDGAHNYQSASKLKKSLEFYFTNKRIIYIIGMFKDKEYEEVLSKTCGLAEHIITITIEGNQRSLTAWELAQAAGKYHPRVTTADSLEEAIELSYLLADKASVIIAFGSLSYLGKCMQLVNKRLEMGKKTHDR